MAENKASKADKTNEANEADGVANTANVINNELVMADKAVDEFVKLVMANEAVVELVVFVMANKDVDSDNEDGVLENELAGLEKLDAANKAIVFNEPGELSERTMTNNDELIVAGSSELDEFVEADKAV